jgi:hypothetical protein
MAGDADDDTGNNKYGGSVVTVLAILVVAAVAAVFLVVGWISALGEIDDGSIFCSV